MWGNPKVGGSFYNIKYNVHKIRILLAYAHTYIHKYKHTDIHKHTHKHIHTQTQFFPPCFVLFEWPDFWPLNYRCLYNNYLRSHYKGTGVQITWHLWRVVIIVLKKLVSGGWPPGFYLLCKVELIARRLRRPIRKCRRGQIFFFCIRCAWVSICARSPQ